MMPTRFRVRPRLKIRNVRSRFEIAQRKFLFRAGGRWRFVAAARVQPRGRDAANPGSAPNSHTGDLKRGFRYEVRGERVVGGIAFRASATRSGPQKIAKYLEKGGRTPSGKKYLPRPILAPAVRKIAGDLPRMYAEALDAK